MSRDRDSLVFPVMVLLLAFLTTLLASLSACSSGWAADHLEKAAPIASTTWFNSPPIRPADLEGRVTLVEFWTFGCGNCQATVPAMERLWADYRKRGLVVIGVHTPETEYERAPQNVRSAIASQGISFPVALDPDYRIWKSFHNRYWPSIYVVDGDGSIRFQHVGELHVGTDDWRALVRELDDLLNAREGSRNNRR